MKKIVKAVKKIVTGGTRFQSKPPKGKTYLRGRLVDMPKKK